MVARRYDCNSCCCAARNRDLVQSCRLPCVEPKALGCRYHPETMPFRQNDSSFSIVSCNDEEKDYVKFEDQWLLYQSDKMVDDCGNHVKGTSHIVSKMNELHTDYSTSLSNNTNYQSIIESNGNVDASYTPLIMAAAVSASTHTIQGRTRKRRAKSCSSTADGRWSLKEHELFLLGMSIHGNRWCQVAKYIQTRSSTQVRSHAQKYFATQQAKKNIPRCSLRRTCRHNNDKNNSLNRRYTSRNCRNNPQPKELSLPSALPIEMNNFMQSSQNNKAKANTLDQKKECQLDSSRPEQKNYDFTTMRDNHEQHVSHKRAKYYKTNVIPLSSFLDQLTDREKKSQKDSILSMKDDLSLSETFISNSLEKPTTETDDMSLLPLSTSEESNLHSSTAIPYDHNHGNDVIGNADDDIVAAALLSLRESLWSTNSTKHKVQTENDDELRMIMIKLHARYYDLCQKYYQKIFHVNSES